MIAHHGPHGPLWKRLFSLPKTRLGWYSLGFVAAHMLLMFMLGLLAAALSAAGLPNMAGHPWLIAAVLVLALGPAVAGISTGLVAVLWQGERSALVLLPLLLVTLFLLAEALIPH